MSVAATRDLSVEAEPASEILANALQALANPDDRPSWEELAALRHRIARAMEKAQEQEAALTTAKQLLREAERARLGLVEELHAVHDELLTHRQVEKALRAFIRDVDKASPIIAEYLAPLARQMASEAKRAD